MPRSRQFAQPAKVLATLLGIASFVGLQGGDLRPAQADEGWTRFRGGGAGGLGEVPGVAAEWTDANTLWRTPLGGVGHGSPVVAAGRLFVTTGDPETGQSSLIALDAQSGKALWRREQPGGARHKHKMNSYASTTPAVGGERVYISGATPAGLYCVAYSHAGDELWRRPLGPYASSHGFASSPIADGGLVFLADDQMEESSIVALDAATGEIAWRAERPSGKASYATPLMIGAGDNKTLVVHSTAAGMVGLNPKNGDTRWRLPEAFPARCVSSPIAFATSDGTIIAGACGGGGSGKQLVGVRIDGDSATESFRMRRSVPYVPTPLVTGDLMLLWHDRGTLAGADAATGELLWEERIGGKYFASPIWVGDAVINISTTGEAVVVRANREGCEVVARNDLGGPTHATPALALGRLFLRTESELICVAGVQTAAAPKPAKDERSE